MQGYRRRDKTDDCRRLLTYTTLDLFNIDLLTATEQSESQFYVLITATIVLVSFDWSFRRRVYDQHELFAH